MIPRSRDVAEPSWSPAEASSDDGPTRAAPFLALAGNIGVGKTTLALRLARRLDFAPLTEPLDDNPYLADFYADMPRWALPTQLRFLAARARDTHDAIAHARAIVQDRTCEEDVEIFAANLHAAGHMTERDWSTYRQIADLVLAGIRPPDLLVYLSASLDDLRARIARRGRVYEQSIPLDYLAALQDRYETWFARYARGPKLRVDTTGLDLAASDPALDDVIERIRRALPQPALF
ncbi:MAG: deoxynucleoside kinase [Deltaproteobacteria bacterium]|nr:deoxynucleoside kinase [Deltaproteobacteria bacterium]